MKTAAGIQTIQYKIIDGADIYSLPIVSGKSNCSAEVVDTKAGKLSKVTLTLKIVDNPNNQQAIDFFLKSLRYHLLFMVTFTSGKVAEVGNADFAPIIELRQDPGTSAGDFVGYIFNVNWSIPLYL